MTQPLAVVFQRRATGLASLGDEVARAVLEALMASKNYEYQSDFARRYDSLARAEALLQVLSARGIEVPDDVRDRILSCRDRTLLDTWLVRAATASSVAEVMGEKQ